MNLRFTETKEAKRRREADARVSMVLAIIATLLGIGILILIFLQIGAEQ